MYKEKHILNKHYGSHTLSRYIDVYELNTVNCSADKTTGYKGDTITITGTPAWNEKTSSYSVTGATLTGNQFNFDVSDVTAQANYETAKTITTHSCSANKVSGFSGDNVTVTGTPAWNQKLIGYGITGATLTGNSFNIANLNVTVQGKYETAKNVTLQTDGHGTIAANTTSGYSGDTVTLTATPNTNYVFSGYTITGATLTGNSFEFKTSDVTTKAWFYYVSPTKNARIAMRFADIAPTIASAGKTYYPFVIMQDLYVTGYTGDNIDSLLANHRVAKAQYRAYPLWNNGDTSTVSADTTARSINFNLVDTVHLYANTGATTAGAYEIRGRCNVNNELVYLQQYVFSSSQLSAHQVNPRNIKDSNNLWIYGRGQGIPEDFTVAGSALYNDALYKCLIPVQVTYWYNSTSMCAPNPIAQHSDIIADITWTE